MVKIKFIQNKLFLLLEGAIIILLAALWYIWNFYFDFNNLPLQYSTWIIFINLLISNIILKKFSLISYLVVSLTFALLCINFLLLYGLINATQ